VFFPLSFGTPVTLPDLVGTLLDLFLKVIDHRSSLLIRCIVPSTAWLRVFAVEYLTLVVATAAAEPSGSSPQHIP
jgi:hypothetical protein